MSFSRKKQKTEKRGDGEIIEMSLCNKISIKLMLANMKKPESVQKNTVSSPLSINLLLNMLANGFEEGSTGRIKLMNALVFTTIDEINQLSSKLMKLMTSDIEPSYEDSEEPKELMDALNNNKRGFHHSSRKKHNASFRKPSLVMANGVWTDRLCPLKPQFVEIATQVYQSCTETLDFSEKERVVEKINSWVEKRTKGLIKGLISQDSVSDSSAIVANALYFNATWEDTFEKSMTKVEKFYLLDGTSIRVPFMKSTKYQFYQSLDGFKLLRLPYESFGNGARRDFSMYFFLPELKNGLEPLLETFKEDPSLVHRKCEGRYKCITWIPRFSILFDFQPSDILKDMGLDLSKMGALTNMMDAKSGGVSKVIQKSYIEVNEKGTEAASASCAYIRLRAGGRPPPPPPPVRFVADRPFFFVIRDDVSGAVLFSGIVRNPLLS